jgi:electron transport complex protein RnfB
VPSATPADNPEAKKRAIIQAALERARKKKEELAAQGTLPQNTQQVSADVQAQIDAAEARRRRLGVAQNDDGPGPAASADAEDAPRNPTPES